MANTVAQASNVKIVFGRKPTNERGRTVPVVSKAQNSAMHAAAEGKSALGIPKKVGEEFTADQPKGSVKKLPARVGKKAKHLLSRGLISQKQHDKMVSDHGKG